MKQLAPNKNQMRRYLEQGLTQAQIAAAWERDSGARVSRSAIGMAIARYGLRSAWPSGHGPGRGCRCHRAA